MITAQEFSSWGQETGSRGGGVQFGKRRATSMTESHSMKTIKHFSLSGILGGVALAAFGLNATVASADLLTAPYNSASDVPITASGYTATGNTVNFTLNCAPATGADLMVVQNTALDFINGTFDNLTNGQAVALTYGGTTYCFVANYYGGSGNDLVLVWASKRRVLY